MAGWWRLNRTRPTLGLKTGEALFVGIYKVEYWKEIPVEEFTDTEIVKELYGHGSKPKNQHHVKWFDLRLMPQMADLKGRLVLTWAEKYAARSWSRWAAPNTPIITKVNASSRAGLVAVSRVAARASAGAPASAF
jgi:hypothetical protein